MEGKLTLFIGITVLVLILTTVLFVALGSAPADPSCGGFAGKSCPAGYHCQIQDDYPDATGICINMFQPVKDKIDQIFPQLKKPQFTCPVGEWVDCMPGPGPVKSQCQREYLDWAVKNCPGFKGAAY